MSSVAFYTAILGGLNVGVALMLGSRLSNVASLYRSPKDITPEERARLVKEFTEAAYLPKPAAELANVLEQKPVLTGNEREFFGRICRAVPELKVFPQVSMGALIEVAPEAQDDIEVRDAFSRKIVDYVVCTSKLKVVALVELDDAMHDATRDQARDQLTEAAGYRTLRWNSRNKPSEAEIREAIMALVPSGA